MRAHLLPFTNTTQDGLRYFTDRVRRLSPINRASCSVLLSPRNWRSKQDLSPVSGIIFLASCSRA
jgi:hypothetical protein